MILYSEIDGAGVPVVMSAGIGHDLGVWSTLASALSGHARVLRWDHRGHGQSQRSDDPEDYGPEQASADLDEMIARVGGSRENPVTLIGHSLGGYLSLRAAAKSPEMVKALVLIGTGPGFRDDAAREKWNQHVLDMKIASGMHPEARRLGMQVDGLVIEKLASLPMPTLVIVGSGDREFIAAKDYMVTKIPRAHGVVIKNGRHSVHKTHPLEVARAIVEFAKTAALFE